MICIMIIIFKYCTYSVQTRPTKKYTKFGITKIFSKIQIYCVKTKYTTKHQANTKRKKSVTFITLMLLYL